MPVKCHVIGCDKPTVATGLCQMHYKRKARQGTVEPTRPSDWGDREVHPAYKTWCGLLRYHRENMDTAWRDDFWSFVAAAGDRPAKAKAHRQDKMLPWSATNFYWKENRASSDDRKEYMREWHRKSRAANPAYYANFYLQKNYGVTYDWYAAQLEKQAGVCAICNSPEITHIRGKLLSLAVDHCHETGKVRGLLCRACNNAIGALKHNVGILQAAIEYLNKG